ncbi:MAG: TAXI family TRAP transporter solute-binding subunit [Alphaproteobacteria bacterium]|nr:TAXI family TRAP transporter solute-binding subunit [Alphaproteobacteria bacterium]
MIFRSAGRCAVMLAASVLVFSLGVSSVVAQSQTKPATSPATHETITIGGGPPFGFYFAVAGSICERAQGPNLRCQVESNANSIENLRALRAGRVDFAIVQSDWLLQARKGTGVFHDAGADKSLRTVLSLHGEALSVFVRDDAIKTLSDLRGKRINLGPPTTYHRMYLGMLLRSLNLDRDDFAKVVEIDAMAQEKAFCAGEIDIAAIVTAHPSAAVATLIKRCGAKLLPIPDAVVKKIIAGRPELSHLVIPGDAYGAVRTLSFGVRAVLASRANVSTHVVETVFRAVRDDLDRYRNSHAAFATLDAAALTQGLKGVMTHKGAASAK